MTAADRVDTVDATGTRRRLQALAAIGWTRPQLAARLQETPARVEALLSARAVPAPLAARVRAVYDELWDVWPEGPAAARARTCSRRRDWAVPMAWDDDPGDPHHIDDPAARPPEGWQRVPRARRRSADLAAEAADLMAIHGITRAQAAERLRITRNALDKALARAGATTPTTSTEEDTHHAA